jgi:hypothetical protein
MARKPAMGTKELTRGRTMEETEDYRDSTQMQGGSSRRNGMTECDIST